MNQKVVIYIILSAILLYLYYKRGGIAIFAAFVVMVAGTLFASKREGFGFGGFGGGKGGDKVDSACAKLGFKQIKLDKDDLAGTLEHVIKNIEKVAAKHWPYDIRAETQDKEKSAELQTFIKVWQKKAKAELGGNEKKDGQFNAFLNASFHVYEKKRYNEIVAEKPETFKQVISGGEITLKLLEKLSKSDEIDADFKKKNFKYLNCLCKYWINLYKEVLKATGGGGGDDEEEKSKKKKKKKASEDDEGGGDDEEEKPKKKKKATEDGDDEEEEKPKKKKKKATEDDE